MWQLGGPASLWPWTQCKNVPTWPSDCSEFLEVNILFAWMCGVNGSCYCHCRDPYATPPHQRFCWIWAAVQSHGSCLVPRLHRDQRVHVSCDQSPRTVSSRRSPWELPPVTFDPHCTWPVSSWLPQTFDRALVSHGTTPSPLRREDRRSGVQPTWMGGFALIRGGCSATLKSDTSPAHYQSKSALVYLSYVPSVERRENRKLSGSAQNLWDPEQISGCLKEHQQQTVFMFSPSCAPPPQKGYMCVCVRMHCCVCARFVWFHGWVCLYSCMYINVAWMRVLANRALSVGQD